MIIPTCLLCQMQAILSGAEFLSTISKSFVIACLRLRLSQNVKLGTLMWQSSSDGKEMYKKA